MSSMFSKILVRLAGIASLIAVIAMLSGALQAPGSEWWCAGAILLWVVSEYDWWQKRQ